jgi:hypothetical protein
MGFDLHLILKGLCAVVPGGPVPEEPGPLPHLVPDLKVLVLDAKAGTVAGFPICEHVAQLRAEQPQGPDRVVPLAGHSIAIDPVPASPTGVALNPTFWDVAHMNRVYPTFTVTPAFLQNPPGIPDVVTAHLSLAAGAVSGLDFSPQILSFPSVNYSGRFALSMRIKVRIDNATATLIVTPFGGGQETRVTLAPKPGKDFVEVTLSNLCSQEDAAPGLAGFGMAAANLPGLGPQRLDFDFAVYYRLEQALRNPVLVPEIVHGKPKTGELPGGATQPGGSCIPTWVSA